MGIHNLLQFHIFLTQNIEPEKSSGPSGVIPIVVRKISPRLYIVDEY
ncbi:MAG: hypothetical protein ACPKQO_10090 [Nitrososphaeraceae archaeon]